MPPLLYAVYDYFHFSLYFAGEALLLCNEAIHGALPPVDSRRH